MNDFTNDDKQWLKEALFEAEKAADIGEIPVGALIVRKGEVLARTYNRRETEKDPTAHAEILAIRKASEKISNWRLEECELYVTLEPCLMCLASCTQARIKRLIYGAQDSKGGALSLGYFSHQDGKMNHRFETQLLDTPECGKILSDFFSQLRRSN